MIQSKVSMVMTCYNKVKDIAATFETVLAQEWDNIELILVDDGSTDGTSALIDDYIPRFRNRGFEVTLVRQENAGVAAASKAGLERTTGDYVCLVDCDDFYHENYCTLLAGYLDTHPDIDVVRGIHFKNNTRKTRHTAKASYDLNDKFARIRHMLMADFDDVKGAMCRQTYLEKIHFTDLFVTEIRTTQEPSFWMPLLINNGHIALIPDIVYTYNLLNDGVAIGRHPTYAYWRYKLDNWYEICKRVIRIYDPINEQQLCGLSDLCKEYRLLTFCFNKNLPEYKQQFDKFRESFSYFFDVEMNDSIFTVDEKIFFSLTKNILLGDSNAQKFQINANQKIIAYGILGQRGQRYLSMLYGTEYEPNELWDANGDGIEVKRPDFSRLSSDDLIIVFPADLVIDTTPARQITYNEIEAYILRQKFQKFFKAMEGKCNLK
jgi:glycosyltransferase involved in cell wall biosynthesis